VGRGLGRSLTGPGGGKQKMVKARDVFSFGDLDFFGAFFEMASIFALFFHKATTEMQLKKCLESLQKFSTTLRSKKKCRCQFSDFLGTIGHFSIYL
jgi:hypothetical protein